MVLSEWRRKSLRQPSVAAVAALPSRMEVEAVRAEIRRLKVGLENAEDASKGVGRTCQPCLPTNFIHDASPT
jgi:hypothetical protein